MTEITYRAATTEDVGALAFLRWSMEAERAERVIPLEEYTAAYAADTRAELERGAHQAWLAEDDGRPVACVLLIWWAMPPNFASLHRKRGFVSSVYTLPDYRRRGIARHLMKLLIQHARDNGLQRLILWSSDVGRPLYESLGFSTSRGLELDL